MSSIMDALKRIERDEQGRHELPPFDLPPEGGRRPRRMRRWILRAGAAGANLAGTAVGALWMLGDSETGAPGRDELEPIVVPAPGSAAPPVAEVETPSVAVPAALPTTEQPPTETAADVARPTPAHLGPVPAEGAPADADTVLPAAAPTIEAAPIEATPVEPVPPLPADLAAALAEAARTVPGDASPQTGGADEDPVAAGRLQELLRERRRAAEAQRAAAAAAFPDNAARDVPRPWQRPLAVQGPEPPPPATETHGDVAAAPAPDEPLAAGTVAPVGDPGGDQTHLAARQSDDAFPDPSVVDRPSASDDEAPVDNGARARPPDTATAAIDTAPVEPPRPGETGTSPGEPVARRPPRGAPRVHVSFLFYSEDPGRRRVMLTMNNTADLITLYEGQTHDVFEVAKILPGEVHLRYQGQLFAVQPRY